MESEIQFGGEIQVGVLLDLGGQVFAGCGGGEVDAAGYEG